MKACISAMARARRAYPSAGASQNGEMVALREVSTSRKGLLDALSGWAHRQGQSGPELKSVACSKWGIAGFKITPETSAIVKAQPKSKYPLGMLKGVNAELDALIAKHPNVDAYEVPFDQEVLLNFEKGLNKPVKMKNGFDWGASGNKHSLAKGFRFIDLGDHFLLVDHFGQSRSEFRTSTSRAFTRRAPRSTRRCREAPIRGCRK